MTAKQYLGIALILGCSVTGLFNIVCAALFGAVAGPRMWTDWIYFDGEPVRFLWTLSLSIICFVGMGGLGGLMIWSERQERRFLKRRSSQPRHHDHHDRSPISAQKRDWSSPRSKRS